MASSITRLATLPSLIIVPTVLAAFAAVVARAEPRTADGEREHWAFRRLARPAPPKVRHTDRVRTPVDAFLLAKLERKGLTFSTDAGRVTLLRRAYLDLIGLPPTLQEVDDFLADHRPDAYERLLDRLLASPHFGERWGRHWLDVAGYADTVGFDVDANNIILAEGKWKYRDYVIAAFNADKPYDRFITEQLAGDELVDWRKAPTFTAEIRDSLIATGFLRTARDESHEPESNIPLTYYGVLHNTVEIVGNSLLGLTLNCTRCHDHKFDPIPQQDYYQLMALFTPAYNPKDWKPVFAWKPEIKDRGLPDVSPAEAAAIDRHNLDIDRQIAALKRQQTELRRPYESRLFAAKLDSVPEPIRADTKAALETPEPKRNEIQKYLAHKFEAALKVPPQETEKALSAADRDKAAELVRKAVAFESDRRKYGKLQALYDVGPPPPTHLLKRGEYAQPGPQVSPGFIRVLCDSDAAAIIALDKPMATSSGRRTALARWLTAPDTRASALLARVMVNRVWQHLFGQGIVATPENLGLSGELPTHPELLEWLSVELIRNGWRIKPLIKTMMTSTAYRQASQVLGGEWRVQSGETKTSSAHRLASVGQAFQPAMHSNCNSRTERAEHVDPGNRLLWRMRLRRLEAEVIRDAMLAVGGRLNRTMGGPPVLINAQPDGMVVIDQKSLPNTSDKDKRSIYLLFRRAYNLSLLAVFDQPLVAVNCPGRDASAVPLQSLTMLNDSFVTEQAEHCANRVARLAGTAGEPPIRIAFRLVLARRPSADEIAVCLLLLQRQAAIYQSAKLPADQAAKKALVQLCHTILNTSEFLYAE